MKRLRLIALMVLGAPLIVGSPDAMASQVVDWDSAYLWADDKIKELTLEDKLNFMRGYSDFYFYGVPGKGIPFLYHSDATAGVNIRRNLPDTTLVRPLDRSTAMPCPIMLAATFNPTLAYRYAEAVGEECRAGGIEILLGPGVNITRNSQCGRNFEYLGEDPFLSGVICAAYVRGMQSTGTAACLKHFICNGTEFYRRRSNSVVDERTLHEIYMPPFKAGVDAGVAFVMTSYNQLNGEWTGQSRDVIIDMLRGDIGFKGCVLSDWSSVYDTRKVILNGVNTEMPGRKNFVSEARSLLEQGKISEFDIDRMIRPALATGYAYGLYDRPKYRPELLERYPEHARVARQVAAEGTVLLKNDGLLPLTPDSKLVVVGAFIDEVPRTGDNPAASAAVKGYDNVTLREALVDKFGENVSFLQHPSADELSRADVVLVSVGTIDMESFERPFALPSQQEKMVRLAAESNPRTIVLVNSGSGVRMSSWANKAAAIIYGWYPGQNGMSALADIITGEINPSGKLPLSIEREFAHSPAKNTMPAGAEFYHKAYRAYNEKLISLYDVNYDEGVLVGYRWYDAKGIEPLFPFGHGLTYTTWSLSDAEVSVSDNKILVTCSLHNTGDCDGAQVVQVYVTESAPAVVRPPRELKAFNKVEVEAGKSEIVKFDIDIADIGYYDCQRHGWVTEAGEYVVSLGFSSRELPVKLKVCLDSRFNQ